MAWMSWYLVRMSAKNSCREVLVTTSGAVMACNASYAALACRTGLKKRMRGLMEGMIEVVVTSVESAQGFRGSGPWLRAGLGGGRIC